MSDLAIKFFTDVSPDIACLMIEANGKRLLVDTGRKEYETKANKILSRLNLELIDAILITHYHGDHSNLLGDILTNKKFTGKVICHKATAEILQTYYNLEDYHNRFIGLDYEETFYFFDSSEISLFDAGHVLGSSMIYLKLNNKRILITGDLGADFLPIVKPPTTLFPTAMVDLLIVDAKQVHKKREINSRFYPLGDILYCKLRDCFQFDNGNVLMYAPQVQLPMLLYCLNYIFHTSDYMDVHRKIENVYLDPQPKTLKLIDIFNAYQDIFDVYEKERVFPDAEPLNFPKLTKKMPETTNIKSSIIITANRKTFIKWFEIFKRSEKNDVLLLSQNIYSALLNNTKLIDKYCDIQIKRLPSLHFHPDIEELSKWCNKITAQIGVKKILFYHHYLYANDMAAINEKLALDDAQSVHELRDQTVVV